LEARVTTQPCPDPDSPLYAGQIHINRLAKEVGRNKKTMRRLAREWGLTIDPFGFVSIAEFKAAMAQRSRGGLGRRERLR
jgi:hypothetical protein